jgi:hypothetical protein
VRFDSFWSLQFDRFDNEVPGRIWRTEASVGYSDDAALAGVPSVPSSPETALALNHL